MHQFQCVRGIYIYSMYAIDNVLVLFFVNICRSNTIKVKYIYIYIFIFFIVLIFSFNKKTNFYKYFAF